MPRCDGLPNEPCPRNANGRNVRASQGELMLCPHCDAIRFPPDTAKTITKAATKTATKAPAERCSTSTNCGKYRDNRTLNTAPKMTSQFDDSHDELDNCCASCQEPCSGSSSHVVCSICESYYHQGCSGLAQDVFDVLMSIVKQAGWVCHTCRDEGRSRIAKVEIALAKTNEELADVKTVVAGLTNDLEKSIQTYLRNNEQTNPVATSSDGDQPTDRQSETLDIHQVRLEFYRSTHDTARRKRNVVITGLPEPVAESDDEMKKADGVTFSKLCEEHLSVKPSLARGGCIRLGRRDEHRPRRLLVQLTSEFNAASVLAAAKKLRQCDDDYISRNVFINQDLSPIEAKLAYEKRQEKRRLRLMATEAQSVEPTDNPGHPSFQQ